MKRPYDECLQTLKECFRNKKDRAAAEDSDNWRIGDAAAYIKEVYGDVALRLAAKEVGVQPATLKQYAWVSTTFPAQKRCRYRVSWSHFRTVAHCKHPDAVLNCAVKKNMSVKAVRDYLVSSGNILPTRHTCVTCGELFPENKEKASRITEAGVTKWVCSYECAIVHYRKKSSVKVAA